MKNVIMPKFNTPNGQLAGLFGRCLMIVALTLVPLTTLVAQQSPFAAAAMKTALIEPGTPLPLVQRSDLAEREHRFWDRDNSILFATVGAMNAADFYVTRNNLAHGGRELNPLTRPFAGSTAGLAFNFAAETASYIAVSYFFHRTGHHKLERVTSLVSIGGSAGAVAYGIAHR
jgi:hypothetical protein